jgi:hypothetical protein
MDETSLYKYNDKKERAMSMIMKRKQKLKGGNGFDVVGSWRKLYCYLHPVGTAKFIKKKMNKRKMHTREDT